MKTKKLLSVLLTVMLILSVFPITVSAESTGVTLAFTDEGITEIAVGTGYVINGTSLSITAAGVYTVTGSCSEGSIEIAKSVSGVTLILDSLTLSSSATAPIVIKKTAEATIHLTGTSTLTDNEDPANETSSDPTVSEAYEGAVIKVKSGASLTFCGDGNLNIVANSKNGIKGGSTTSITFNQSGSITVTGSGKYYGGTTSGAAVNNGIACDGSLVFNQGTYVIKAANDGIKSAPDATDTTAGTTIDTDSAGTITINGGTFDIDCDGDGIQADTALTITDGTFDIQTWKGYSVWNDTLANAYSCKGLKAGGDRATEAELEPTITVSGGTFSINTGDDAIHSDAYATITGGTFDIYTGDDGAHADTTLTLGEEGGLSRDPDITVNSSYEGLEGGTVYIYSGRYSVTASDDGINAAGGSSNGSDPSQGGDPFNPGGGGPGHGGPGGGGFNPGGGSSSSGDYNIYIYGGDIYVNCTGDGLDSNGGLYLYGGNISVSSMQSGGDNSPFDSDGTWLISGATIFGAGTNSMNETPASGSQKYYTSTTSRNAGTSVSVSYGGNTVYSGTLPRRINYLIYSSPSMTSTSCTVTTASSATACLGGSQSHYWNSGIVTTAATSSSVGLITYTCTSCGATEQKTVPATVEVPSCDHSVENVVVDEGYSVTFAGDAGVGSITVYLTQDYSGESESIAPDGTTVSRSSDTGEPDSTGSGQVNFTVVLAEGYSIDSISATAGTYKNIKGPADTGLANTYRITKITSDTTVTITTVQCAHGAVAAGTAPSWTWGEGYGSATLSYMCAECGGSISVNGTVTSVLTDASTITFTATASIGSTVYSDTQTAAPFTATFASDHATVYVYYTQNYTSADEIGAAAAVARDSDTGCPVVTGDGQINFSVVADSGYEIEGVTAEGSYKNLKDISSTAGIENCYRITKITGALTVTVATSETQIEVTPGDVDGDGNVTSKDSRLLKQYLVGLVGDEDIIYVNADVDGDGDVTSKDVRALKQLLVS
ncbi:MAG: carbohydrate-binding domain-containing protein [Clostridia bacterium]|nr:carbohydrate-binding domain-containing protein [Clostridia bacterium]